MFVLKPLSLTPGGFCAFITTILLVASVANCTSLVSSETTRSLERRHQDLSSIQNYLQRRIQDILQTSHGWRSFTEGDAHSKTTLLVATTCNVRDKTKLLLSSLWSTRDEYDVLVVDESSTDGTPRMLSDYNISTLQVPPGRGVTYNWNVAYDRFMKSSYKYLFLANNDVLVPDGAMSMLEESLDSNNCDLVVPMSTVRGKGHWGDIESIEVIYQLSQRQAAWVNQPMNYNMVQQMLLELHKHNRSMCTMPLRNSHKPGFSGFFFGVRKTISQVAYSGTELWAPSKELRVIGQEGDLWRKAMHKGGLKFCINICSFAFHYKASTIPWQMDRTKWVRDDLGRM